MLVTCQQCGAKVSANQQVVRRSSFTQARERMWPSYASGAANAADRRIKVGDHVVRLLAHLARGTSSDVFLGERVGPFLERFTVKIAHHNANAKCHDSPLEAMRALQTSTVVTAPFFTTQLPQITAAGVDHLLRGDNRAVLLLRHPSDYWGSLNRVSMHNNGGIDARHVVWMGARCIDLLGFIHASGWTHGALSLDHLLVQPRDHAMMFVGWSHARPTGADASSRARDWSMLAWSLRRLISVAAPTDLANEPKLRDDVPAPLAAALVRISEDRDWVERTEASAMRGALMLAAEQSFGPRQFVAFDPRSAKPAAIHSNF